MSSPVWSSDDPALAPYQEPRFGQPLFKVEQLSLEAGEAEAIADELVRAAYFLCDQPGKSGEALALADAFVPRHSGTRVANFRLRRGFGAAEFQMIVVDDMASVLVRAAVSILEHAGDEGKLAAGYLVDIAGALPIEDSGLLGILQDLSRVTPEANWEPAFSAASTDRPGVGNS